jgi:CRISPR-associated protein Cas1
MRKLLRTLYITAPEAMTLDEGTLVITLEDQEIASMPLRYLETICYFGYKPIRPALMDACAEYGVRISVFHPDGQFISEITGNHEDSFILRRRQYAVAGDTLGKGLDIARNIVAAKIFNSRWLIGRMYNEYEGQIDVNFVKERQGVLKNILREAFAVREIEPLYEIRKRTARETYSYFNDVILRQKKTFAFKGRSTRLPMDPVNILLSFAYDLLEEMCRTAVLAMGLDPYVGFFHKEKPGQESLVLDLMEEFKACIADRFVIMLINGRRIGKDDFAEDEDGDLILTEDGKAAVLEYWEEFNNKTIMHPYQEEKIEWGMLPNVSAMLLSRYLLGKIDKYPPFFRQNP